MVSTPYRRLYRGLFKGVIQKVNKGDTRSLDYGLYGLWVFRARADTFCRTPRLQGKLRGPL